MSDEIDQIVEHAILHKAFPGCVIYASHQGDPFFFKAYGYHTYDSINEVLETDIYDLASVTKVASSTLALMKLYEDGKFDLDEPIGKYIQGIGRKVGRITFRKALAHFGGLEGWIPYYSEVRKKNGKYKRHTLSDSKSDDYSYQIASDVFLHQDFYQKIKRYIRKSKVNTQPEYRYSGLFFYLIPELVKELSGDDFETYLYNNFYKTLKTKTLGFNPLETFGEKQIVPTEIDTFFRMSQIHGVVHDEGAIMMKGVSGNAGLFGNGQDVASLMQMLVNGGEMNGIQYLDSSTISLFTSYQYPDYDNRRGLGFDKPLLEYDSVKSSVAKSSGAKSYGHSGYTGTLVWADPDSELVYVFLSNRVYPNRKQKAIYELNVRPDIHQLLYDFIENKQVQME
ncbi:MAG: serine hydrolase [Cyclobacteriaceae bacterium]